MNIPKEVKFVKAKEFMVAASNVEKENVEKRSEERRVGKECA